MLTHPSASGHLLQTVQPNISKMKTAFLFLVWKWVHSHLLFLIDRLKSSLFLLTICSDTYLDICFSTSALSASLLSFSIPHHLEPEHFCS